MTYPSVYACTGCGKKGVKLWRDSHTFCIDRFLCRDCAEKDPEVVKYIKDYYSSATLGPAMMAQVTDQIGGLVPVVPDPLPQGPDWKLTPNVTIWGYTSVPSEGCAWWNSLAGRGMKTRSQLRMDANGVT